MFAPHIHEGKPRERPIRSLIKTVVYRVFSTADTAFLAWLFTGPLQEPLGGLAPALAAFATVDMLWNTVFYYINERVWAHIDLRAQKKQEALRAKIV